MRKGSRRSSACAPILPPPPITPASGRLHPGRARGGAELPHGEREGMRTLIILSLIILIGLSANPARAANVALSSNGAVAIADSEYGAQVAANAVDGKWVGPSDPPDSNRWHSSLSRGHPHWIWVRFREPAQISRVVIRRADLSAYPVDFVGEWSPDGGLTFQTLFTVTDSQMDADTFAVEQSFAPVVTDNFRLRITRSSNAQHPEYAQMSELEVHGEFVDGPSVLAEAAEAEPPIKPVLMPTREKNLTVTERGDEIEFRSRWLRLAVSRKSPRITALCWDSLGEGKLDENLLKPEGAGPSFAPCFSGPDSYQNVEFEKRGNVVRYRIQLPGGGQSLWELRVGEKRVRMVLTWTPSKPVALSAPPGIRFPFACEKTPVAPFANPTPEAAAPLPCIVHAPDYGSLLVQRADRGRAHIEAESLRPQAQWNATVALAGDRRDDGLYIVDPGTSRSILRLSVAGDTIPLARLVRDEPRLRAMQRHWLSALQYRPDIGILSNNIVSDNCSFCMYEYADIAAFTPPLPGGIEAIELVRESLDRYLAGARGYGIGAEDVLMDVCPAHLIAAWNVIRVTGDMGLLRKWLPRLEGIASRIEGQDRDGNGLPESTRPGTSGRFGCPTSNWWDQINFGHEDAYACALAYRAFRCMADLERLAERPEQAARYERDADRIRDAYLPNFLNPKTGVIAGWKDVNGELHDYWFVFVNGIAIAYGLVPDDRANTIVDRIEAKMRDVGYSRFDLGLPGPLIPIPKNEYGLGALGSPQKDDGTDTWQVFENGGASACMAYFYVQALYKLGRRHQAERILWAMMRTYADGGFQNGVGKGGEWRYWDGRPSGYEGFLTDAYYTQLVVFTGHYGISFGPEGFRLEPWSPLKGKRIPLGLKYMGKVVKDIR